MCNFMDQGDAKNAIKKEEVSYRGLPHTTQVVISGNIHRATTFGIQ